MRGVAAEGEAAERALRQPILDAKLVALDLAAAQVEVAVDHADKLADRRATRRIARLTRVVGGEGRAIVRGDGRASDGARTAVVRRAGTEIDPIDRRPGGERGLRRELEQRCVLRQRGAGAAVLDDAL